MVGLVAERVIWTFAGCHYPRSGDLQKPQHTNCAPRGPLRRDLGGFKKGSFRSSALSMAGKIVGGGTHGDAARDRQVGRYDLLGALITKPSLAGPDVCD